MVFDLNRIHKLDDWLESEAYEWVSSAITEHFEVENITDLTEVQIDEVADYVNRLDAKRITSNEFHTSTLSHAQDLSALVIGTMFDQWQDENESEYCFEKGYR